MNRIITSFLLALFPLISLGQNQFKLNSITRKVIPVIVNGDTINVDSTFTTIETNFPLFDTLFLENSSTPVICNFKPDSLYTLIFACCGSIDIVPSWKVDNVSKKGIDYDDNRYQELLQDRPSFTLKVINNKGKDSIYGWYEDHACFPSFKLLTYEPWNYGPAQKCYYWNNISSFVFFKSNQTYSENTHENGLIEWFPYPHDDENVIIEKVGRIRVRLFDDDQYTIVYDAQSPTVYLEN